MDIEYTNERFLPEFEGNWTLEHTHRYSFSRELADGKAVLDIACGDGYGSRMMADVAKSVVGVDISRDTVIRAARKYPYPGLSFVCGSAAAIPLADDSVDLVTSFETIEHLTEHDAMLDEIRRVLRPGGLLIMSSPDRYEYSDKPGYVNEYHVRELYRNEFEALLQKRFSHMRMLGQRLVFGSVMGSEHAEGAFLSWDKDEPDLRAQGLSGAEYLIALAGDGPLPCPPSSVFKGTLEKSDQYLEQYRRAEILDGELTATRVHVRNLESIIRSLESDLNAAQTKMLALEAELAGVYGSRSWKLTAPLRFVMARARRYLKLSARPAPSVRPKDAGPWPPDVRARETSVTLDATAPAPATPLGVFLHVYYTELAEEMLAHLRFLPPTAVLHISTDTEEKRAGLDRLFSGQGFGGRVEIRTCPNRGWDMAPFFVGFADRIPQYPLLLRLHSKRSPQFSRHMGEYWRKMLFSSLCGSEGRVNAIVRAFERNPELGVLCPPTARHNSTLVSYGHNFAMIRDMLRPHGVDIRPDTPLDFPVGSMFWCRPAALAPWLDRNLTYDDFAPTVDYERDGSLAHALERLILFGCCMAGLTWGRVPELK